MERTAQVKPLSLRDRNKKRGCCLHQALVWAGVTLHIDNQFVLVLIYCFFHIGLDIHEDLTCEVKYHGV